MSVDLLPGCSLSGDPVQKSAISEMTAQRLALCNSFCINRVRYESDDDYFNHAPIANHILMRLIFLQALSGDFALNNTQKQVQHN